MFSHEKEISCQTADIALFGSSQLVLNTSYTDFLQVKALDFWQKYLQPLHFSSSLSCSSDKADPRTNFNQATGIAINL